MENAPPPASGARSRGRATSSCTHGPVASCLGGWVQTLTFSTFRALTFARCPLASVSGRQVKSSQITRWSQDHQHPGLGSKERQRRSHDKDKEHPSPQSFHTIMNLSEPYILSEEYHYPYSTEEETEAHGDSTTGAQGNPANAPGSNLSRTL